jgi:Cas7 group CRISPR-associated protein Csh2
MTSTVKNDAIRFNRGTGLLVIEVRHSNPNGDPDAESEPRTIDGDGRGLISPVSFKRKLRDLVADHEGPAWQESQRTLKLSVNGDHRQYNILESRHRDLKEILKMKKEEFIKEYWDGRVFGNTTLEKMEEKEGKRGEKDHFISTGVVQFGPGVSTAQIEVERLTMTGVATKQEGKSRSMAPLGWRVVRHAVYAMPFFVNPMMARKTGCHSEDIDLMKFLIPHAYRNTASAIRPFVEIRHAWYAEHKTPLGSCPDSLIIDAMTPTKIKGKSDEASTSIDEYKVPTELDLPKDIRERLQSFEDLCVKVWG